MYVKSKVVSDTVELAKKSVAKLSSTERFNSLLRISPSSADDGVGEKVYNTVQMLRRIFYSIAPIKSKGVISSQNFEKLFSKDFIKNKMAKNGFKKTDMGLMFSKQAGNARQLEFLDFCDLLRKFHSKFVLKYQPNVWFTKFLYELE